MKEKGEKEDKETPTLQIDPKCIQDALGVLFQPVKSYDPRLEFYAIYQRVATKYDADYAKARNVDLNVMLILAGLLSAVSTAFIVDINSKIDPPPGQPSAPFKPPISIYFAALLMYASLGFSLMATFVTMMEKERLNRDSLPMGRSVIERCRYRQRKLDRHQRFRFWLSVASPRFIKVALLFLACGLCARTVYTYLPLGILTGAIPLLALLAYFHLVYFAPESEPLSQTRVFVALRRQWARKDALNRVWDAVLYQICRVLRWLQSVGIGRRSHNRSLPTVQPAPQDHIPLLTTQVIPPNPTVTPEPPDQISSLAIRGPANAPQWLTPTDLTILQEANADDAKCVLWVLQRITDPEALDAAIRFATVIRWYEGGLDAGWTRGLIVSFLQECFDFNGMISPGFRDRAYYSVQALIWIRICRRCAPERFLAFSQPDIPRHSDTTHLDRDLRYLLGIYFAWDAHGFFTQMYRVGLEFSPADVQWSSNALLHTSWARRDEPGMFEGIAKEHAWGDWSTIPLNVVLNRLLTWCIFLGWRIGMDALRVQVKSDHSEQIVSQLSQAIASAIRTSHPRCDLLLHMLVDLAGWEQRPSCLTTMVYGLCSVIFENHSNLADGTRLLSLSLQIAFRRPDPQHPQMPTVDHHQRMIDVVFESGDEEAIADLLHAWTSHGDSHEPFLPLGMCASHLIGPRSSSQRLRRLVIRSIELIDPQEFEKVGTEGFCQRLDHLQVGVEDMDRGARWVKLLAHVIQRAEGARRLPHSYWETLTELLTSESQLPEGVAWDPDVVTNLGGSQEWDKLERWMGIVWMVWPSGTEGSQERRVWDAMLSLVREQPGASTEFKQWMERWSDKHGKSVPQSFQEICDDLERDRGLAHDASAPTIGGGSENPAHTPSPPSSSSPAENAL